MKTPNVRTAGMVTMLKEDLPLPLANVKADLTYVLDSGAVFAGSDSGEKIVINTFSEDKQVVSVPRQYFETKIRPLLPKVRMDDQRAAGAKVSYRFTGKLFVEPDKNQVAACKALTSSEGGILAAATGKGKTVIAIAALAQLGRRSLVIVHTTVLLEQWIKRFLEFTDLKRQDIGIVQSDSCECNRPAMIGMVHSLSQRQYPDELYNSTGVVLTDECHVMGAPTWLTVIPKFPGRVRWGMSATVERDDGMHDAFQSHIGPVVYEMLKADILPTVFCLRTGVALPPRAYTNHWNGKINFARLYSAISTVQERNKILTAELLRAYKAGRKVLALSRRTQHLQAMRASLELEGVPAAEMGVITGSVPKDKRERAKILETCRIVFVSEQIGSIGLDQPDLDTGICLTPIQHVEQPVGRILRLHPGKKPPIWVDFVDDVPVFQRMAKSRQKTYAGLGYTIKHNTVEREK